VFGGCVSDAGDVDGEGTGGEGSSAVSAIVASEPVWGDGTKCSGAPPVQTWAIDANTYALRQSLCTHFEGPFVYLFIGTERALLVDTGTGDANLRVPVDKLLNGKNVDLLVAHSHAHSDHVGGDSQFAGRPRTKIVGHSVASVNKQFEFNPAGIGKPIDLGGGRVLDVLFIPGHESSHIALYDRSTRILFTGDSLYPGRLYVRQFDAFRKSIKRLVDFEKDGHPVAAVLGAHIELNKRGSQFKQGTRQHPDEHVLRLSTADLNDLDKTLRARTSATYTERPNYVVFPL